MSYYCPQCKKEMDKACEHFTPVKTGGRVFIIDGRERPDIKPEYSFLGSEWLTALSEDEEE